ncbi:MAG TPA: extracellular solute-binding protein, partial [Dehalococcoidia bacterium]|nr:extracellular solute-binding protein [Dehalococcoidia bacterium]
PAAAGKEAMDALVAAAKKEGKVTIYASVMAPETMKALGDGFKAAYGINLEWVVTRGAESLERVKTEQATKAYVADVVYSGPGVWPGLKEAGYAVAVDLPVAAETGVWRLPPYDFDAKDRKLIMGNTNTTPGGLGVLMNTKLVPPDKEPKSWMDLLDPFWKGKMIMDDPTVPGPGSDLFTLWRFRKIVPADYFDKLAAQDVKIFRGYPQQADMVSKGEFAIGIVSFSVYAMPHIEAGLPVRPAWLKEGVYAPPMALTQVVNAPNPNAGKLLMNWLLTKEGQTLWHQTEKNLPVRSDVPDQTPQILRIPSGTPIIRQSYDEILLTVKELEQGLAAKLFKK